MHEHVPAIANGVIEVKGIARARGKRVLIAVHSEDESVDSVGTCIGQRGIRIKTIMRNFPGEKFDVIRWSDSPKTLLTNLLMPAKIDEISLQETSHRAIIFTSFEGKRLIMGIDGLRLKLVSELVGLDIQVETG